MVNMQNTVQQLEMLRGLINSSIDGIRDSVIQNGDPPLTLRALEEHPIHERSDPETSYALKTVSSAAQMLRALCDPNRVLNDVTYGYQDETALWVACQADIPNLLGSQARHVDELAVKTGIDADRLGRFLRNLCNCHIFEEVAPNQFANNALSIRFKSEAKQAIVGHCADECRFASCKAWEALTWPEYKDATEINRAPFNIAFETELDYFGYFSTVRKDIGARTKKAMAGKGLNLGQFLSLYPWASEGNAHIVDVGGGIGAATMPIVRAFPDLRLTVQDLPDSAAEFTRNLTKNYSDLAERGGVQFTPLDFFSSPPLHGADVYFMRHVIHDWPDVEATKILKGCAAAMTPQSKLLICEHVVCPTYRHEEESGARGGNEQPSWAPFPLLANFGDSPTSRLDLQVYTCINAKQRTQAEYQNLAARAGLQLVKVWRNMGDLTILECHLSS